VDTLKDVVEKAGIVDQIDIIDISVGGWPIKILRPKKTQAFGFVLWDRPYSGIKCHIMFRMPDGVPSRPFTVVCAHCDSETFGINCPPDKRDDVWRREQRDKYLSMIESTYVTYGIHTLFMYRAGLWSKYYKHIGGLRIFEANDYRDALSGFHSPDVIEEVSRPIHPNSLQV
jgi:hypothetical protein